MKRFLGLFLACALAAGGCSDDSTDIRPVPDKGGNTNPDGGSSATGWKICRANTECGGAVTTCVKISSSTTGMCSRQCNANNPCPSDGVCVEETKLGLTPSCAKACTTITDCATGMKCGTLKDGIKACVPDSWSASTTACTNGQQKCSGQALKTCENGAWKSELCSAICIQAGYTKADKCGYSSNKGKDTCFCSKTACTNGEKKCVGTLTLATCNNGTWTQINCTTECVKAGYAKATSCGHDKDTGKDICYCQSKTCTSGQTKCAGDYSLNICESSSWSTYTCDTLCQKSGFTLGMVCGNDPTTSKDTCACFNGKVGDKCKKQSDCKSSVCSPDNLCTKQCQKDTDCGYNSLSNKNGCVLLTSGAKACFPCCTTNRECMFWPGTTCQSVTTVTGNTVKMCAI